MLSLLYMCIPGGYISREVSLNIFSHFYSYYTKILRLCYFHMDQRMLIASGSLKCTQNTIYKSTKEIRVINNARAKVN